jgi:FkbM family methyltransferase
MFLKKLLVLLANLSRLPEIVGCYRETDQWLTVALAYLGLRELHFPFNLRLRSGETLTLEERVDLVVFWMVFVRRHYPVQNSDRVIVDVGANIGLFTLYAARQAPRARIVAVEPFPETVRRLQRHLQDNRIADRVTVLNCALAAEAGWGEMDSADGIPSQYRRIHSEATATLNVQHRGVAALDESPGLPVENRTLADILELADADNVDLMKMNIHGSEYAVLMKTSDGVLRRFRRIAVQYHDLPAASNMGKTQLFSCLGENGFRLVCDRDTRRGSGLAVLSAAEVQRSKD